VTAAPDPDRGTAEGFQDAWGHLLRHQSMSLHPRSLRRITAGTTALLQRAAEESPFDPALVEQAAAQLVNAHFTDPRLLAGAVDLLQAQPLPDRRGSAIAGAFAVGWAAALRDRTLREQDSIRMAVDSARLEAEQALRASETRFRALFETAAIGIGIGDIEGNILAANRSLLEMFGARLEDLQGRKVNDLVHPEDTRDVWTAYDQLVHGKRESFQCDKPYYRGDGEVVWTHLTCSLIRHEDGSPRYQVAMMEDITDRYRLQDRLRHQATHDPLTGLPNRAAFFERMERLFDTAGPATRFGLCYIDLDGFKVVNDSLGHDTGDQVLIKVAGRVTAALAPMGHLVARLGGDEFVVLLEDSRDEHEAVAVAQTVLAALEEPVLIGGHKLTVGASIGVLERRVASTTPDAAVRAADLTLYRAKESGRGRWTLFNAQRNARMVSRYSMSVRMPKALDRGEFFLEYQPLCSLADGSLAAVEALVRWRHPLLGVLGPDEFVATAEDTGLILPLGRWVLEQACARAAEWPRHFGTDAPQINVNITAHQTRSRVLVADVARILRGTGLDPGRLQLEITESAALRPQDESLEVLNALVDLGVSLSVDDFGTGWCNLAYLRDLPVSALKLSGSFIGGLNGEEQPRDTDNAGWAIVGGVVSLAHSLGLTLTAEGVETPASAERLRQLGCDWGQGWHFGRPTTPEAIEQLAQRPPAGRNPAKPGHST
jgi:diguanylate cyclase (GGDEF)-like protein/PAS domain S-box-containing protein